MKQMDAQARPEPAIHLHEQTADWVAAATDGIAAGLEHALAGGGSARLLVSGGGTPAPVYRALARQPLDWTRIVVGLVDERWLPPGDPDSNGQLVMENLLVGGAARASFQSMLDVTRNLQAAVAQANQMSTPAAVGVFGMGSDGHTASLFPAMAGLAQALDSPDDYVGVDASGCVGAQRWASRISLTPAGIARTRVRLLLIRGEQKLEVLQAAMAADDALQLPVHALLSAPGTPLQVHWCP